MRGEIERGRESKELDLKHHLPTSVGAEKEKEHHRQSKMSPLTHTLFHFSLSLSLSSLLSFILPHSSGLACACVPIALSLVSLSLLKALPQLSFK